MKRYLFLLGLFFVSICSVLAQDEIPNPMSPPRLVNDFAGVFSPAQAGALEQKLRAYHDNTTTQIYVVTVNSLNGDAPYNYATELGNKWGIGQKGKDNGVLILIKPKTKGERGQVFIAPGYGLEAMLNDAFCGRVIDNQMTPFLQENNDYYTATDNAINTILKRIAGEDFNDEGASGSSSWVDIVLACIMLPLFIIFFIISPRFRTVVLFMLALLMRGGGGNGRGGSGGGRGFGGGGGGRFGGGGAGRSW